MCIALAVMHCFVECSVHWGYIISALSLYHQYIGGHHQCVGSIQNIRGRGITICVGEYYKGIGVYHDFCGDVISALRGAEYIGYHQCIGGCSVQWGIPSLHLEGRGYIDCVEHSQCTDNILQCTEHPPTHCHMTTPNPLHTRYTGCS